MLGNLGENLTNTMKKLVGMSVIDKKTIKEVVKDIQRALIQSDVNIKLVLDLSKKIESRALEEEPPKGITPREHVITIIYEEMVNLLGSEAAGLDINDRPYKILFLGLQGSGKTTTIGKLCRYLQKKGFNPAVVCTDTWRPAAYEQLRQLTEEMDVPLYGDPNNKDALDLAQKGLQEFKNRKVIIFDTAGRHKEEADLIAEMDELDNIINPNEAILVIDGTIGQQAGEQARAFSQATDIGSIIITKLDGSAKGGGAMSAVAETGAPIKFIGTGERVDDFELFDPERFISRLLGMGDIKSLIEKAEAAYDEKQAKDLEKKFREQTFSLEDFLDQMRQLKKMGNLDQILAMMPGANTGALKNAQVDEKQMDRIEAMILSMTPSERLHPEIINGSRRKRIAMGSGTQVEDLNRLLRQFDQMKKMMKQFSGKNMKKLAGMRFPM